MPRDTVVHVRGITYVALDFLPALEIAWVVHSPVRMYMLWGVLLIDYKRWRNSSAIAALGIKGDRWIDTDTLIGFCFR